MDWGQKRKRPKKMATSFRSEENFSLVNFVLKNKEIMLSRCWEKVRQGFHRVGFHRN